MTQTHARLVSRYIPYVPHAYRLARVLAHSAATHAPVWTVDVAPIRPRPLDSPLGIQAHVLHTQAVLAWRDVVTQAADGERLLLVDPDTVILRSLEGVWRRPFDLTYTVKPRSARFPFAAGVLFVRVSDRLRAFMTAWAETCRRFLADPVELQPWRDEFGGIREAALGSLFADWRRWKLRRRRLPTSRWQLEEETLHLYHPERTRIACVRGSVRAALLEGSPRRQDDTASVVERWRTLERAA